MGVMWSRQRRDEEMPDGVSGGRGHDAGVEGSILESANVSRSDDEISAHVRDPTHMITQPEDESKNQSSVSPVDSVDVSRNEDGIKDLVPGLTHITRPVSDHHENHPPTGSLGFDIARSGVETNQAPVPDPTPITQAEDESRRRKKRASNWRPDETQQLIGLKTLQNLDWNQISGLIAGRTTTGCQGRWDTVVRAYRKVKRHCHARGKDVSLVTEQEVRSMGVGMHYARYRHWFKMMDEYYSCKSGVPPKVLNGAILRIGMVGDNALPVAPIAVVPNVVSTAPAVQATAGGAADPMAVTVAQPPLLRASSTLMDAVEPWPLDAYWAAEPFHTAGDCAFQIFDDQPTY